MGKIKSTIGDESLELIPDYELFGFKSPEEWAMYKEIQSLYNDEEYNNYEDYV